MSSQSLDSIYHNYIAAINAKESLSPFVSDEVTHNGRRLNRDNYRKLIQDTFDAAPDAVFEIDQLVASDSTVAARLFIHGKPTGTFLGYEPTGRRFHFAEHVFYHFENGKIMEVWSLLDTELIEKQLKGHIEA